MPTLETDDGEPVDLTPAVELAAAQFKAAADGTADADPGALPKRAARGPATDDPKPTRTPKPKAADKSRTTAKPTVTLSADKRRDGVAALVQVAAVLPLTLAKTTGQTAYAADALTIVNSADALAMACVQVADADPKFAAVLDKVCSTGPYGALITVAFGIGAQLVRNHRPAMSIPGTIHPDELLAAAAAA